MNGKLDPYEHSHGSWPTSAIFVFCAILSLAYLLPSLRVHAATAITPTTGAGDLNTTVTHAGNLYNITGGTRPGNGSNLFHSFGDFSVGTGDIANFLNTPVNGVLLPTSNILGRVTGGDPSNILGTIQTTNFGNANLFLMNPAGFLFGPNATVNVGGMVAFTTADYLRLSSGTNNGYFYADPAGPSLLTAAPVAAFGFLGSNAASIAIQGGTLEVRDGKTLSFIGGPRTFITDSGVTVPSGVTMTGGSVSAPNGLIYLATVTTPGEVPIPTLSGGPLGTLGPSPSNPAVIRIRSGEFVMDHAFLTATNTSDAAQPAIEVTVQGTMTLKNVSTISTETFGAGHGNDVHIAAQSLQMDGSSIKSTTTADGRGGDLSIGGQEVSLTNGAQIVSATEGLGQGGNVSVTADSITIAGLDSEGTLPGVLADGVVRSGIFSTSSSLGIGGDITINAPMIALDQLGIIASTTISDRQGGNITVEGTTLSITGGGEIRSETGIIDPDSGDFVGGTGQGGNISITTDESVLVSGLLGFFPSGITSGTRAAGPGGNITLSSHHVLIENAGSLRTFSVGDGTAGDISITASGSLTVRGFQDISIPGLPVVFRMASGISSEAGATGNGGSVNILAGTMAVENQAFVQTITSGQGNTGDLTVNGSTINLSGGGSIEAFGGGTGATGAVTVTASDTLTIQGSEQFDPTHQSRISNRQGADAENGGISIHARAVLLTEGGRILNDSVIDGSLTTITADNSITLESGARIASRGDLGVIGPIELHAPMITFDQGSITTRTITTATGGAILLDGQVVSLRNGSELASAPEESSGRGGPITVLASDSISVSGGSTIQSNSFVDGPAGDVYLNATNSITLSGSGTTVSTQTVGTGAGGAITLQTQNTSVTDGAVVTAKSTGSGMAGSVTIEGNSPAQFILIDGIGSDILTSTAGTGAGGNITLNANTVTIQNGGRLSAATSGTSSAATGGTILVEASQVQLNNGGGITASTIGAGDGGSITIDATNTFTSNASTVSSTATQARGGDIAITAGQSATLSNGSSISASSTGAGNAGGIDINAGQTFLATNSSVTTEANHASGGAIKITTTPSGTVELNNSTISASVRNGAGGGGNVNIDPLYVLMQNSQILAQAVQGPGGNITINITNGGLFLPDGNSTISASSQFGVNGTVTIQNPNAPAGGQIHPLGQSPLLATSLLNQRCAALAGGEFSSFTVAGRDSLPTEPGSWLASPLALGFAGTGGTLPEKGVRAGLDDDPLHESAILSLRQIAPAGFLTQAFAVDLSTSCQS